MTRRVACNSSWRAAQRLRGHPRQQPLEPGQAGRARERWPRARAAARRRASPRCRAARPCSARLLPGGSSSGEQHGVQLAGAVHPRQSIGGVALGDERLGCGVGVVGHGRPRWTEMGRRRQNSAAARKPNRRATRDGRELAHRLVVERDRGIELVARERQRGVARRQPGVELGQVGAGDRLHRHARARIGQDLLGDAQARHRARRAGPHARVLARRVGLAARGAQRLEARRGRGERRREQLELAFEQRMALLVAIVDGRRSGRPGRCAGAPSGCRRRRSRTRRRRRRRRRWPRSWSSSRAAAAAHAQLASQVS